MSSKTTLVKNLAIGHWYDSDDDVAFIIDDGGYTIVDNLIIEVNVWGLHRFVKQPNNCTHAYCGYTGGKKPKCIYISYRPLTIEEASNPEMDSLFLPMNITFLERQEKTGLAIFDMEKEIFVDKWFSDGGNCRLVVCRPDMYSYLSGSTKKTLESKSNYTDLVKTIKSGVLKLEIKR